MRASAPLIAVLGLGEAGLVHAKALLSSGARVGIASKHGASVPFADAVYPSYEAALSDPSVSGVVIATPYPSHPDLIHAAADAGKHILCEKPLGATVDSILPSRASSQKIRFLTGLQRRWDPAYRAARDRLDGSELGVPVLISCMFGDAGYPERLWKPEATFREVVVHDIDLARWLLRDEVESVFAWADALVFPELKEIGDCDTAVGVLAMRRGARAVLTVSRALGYGHKVYTEVVGSKGSVEIGGVQMTDLRVNAEGRSGVDCFQNFTQRFDQAFRRQMSGFVDLVRAEEDEVEGIIDGNCSYAGFDDGVRATAVAEALCESAKTGMPVDVVDLDDRLC